MLPATLPFQNHVAASGLVAGNARTASRALPAARWEDCCLLGPGTGTDDRVPIPGIFPAAVS